jgi:hypothetical protein
MYRVWEERRKIFVVEKQHTCRSPSLEDFSQKHVKNAGTAGTQEREV